MVLPNWMDKYLIHATSVAMAQNPLIDNTKMAIFRRLGLGECDELMFGAKLVSLVVWVINGCLFK